MDITKEAIKKVLDKARSGIDPSKKDQFTDAFAAFMRSQGLVLDGGNCQNFSETSYTFF